MLVQPLQISQGEIEVKGSKFLSFLIPIEDFSTTLKALKSEHPKAVHFVTATRVRGVQIQESFSDDGEPKGSSGVPTLNVLRGENLIDAGAITVRYFGGTLLGVGGLVRAYTQAIQSAIIAAKANSLLKAYEEQVEWEILVPYALFNQVSYLCKQNAILIVQKEFLSSGVKLVLSAPLGGKEKFLSLCQSELDLLC